MSSVFCISDVEPSSRLKRWRDFLAAVYCRLDVESCKSELMHGTLIERPVGDLSVARWVSSGQRLIRRQSFVRQDGSDDFNFAFPISGSFVCRQRGRELSCRPGASYLLKTGEAYEVDIPENAEVLTLRVPRSLLSGRFGDLDGSCAALEVVDEVIVPTIHALAAGVLRTNTTIPEDELSSLLLNMIELTGFVSGGQRENQQCAEAYTAPLLASIKSAISANLRDPRFDVAAAASLCHISTRYLHKLMQLQDTTFNRELMDAKLMKAFRMIHSTECASMQIGEIAYACGFANQGHFATRYRARFGDTPRVHRQEAAARRALENGTLAGVAPD